MLDHSDKRISVTSSSTGYIYTTTQNETNGTTLKNKTESLFFFLSPFFLIYLGFAAALNCTSPTPNALFQALDTDVFQNKMIRPVKNLSEPLNITIDITLVEILGVVSATWIFLF